MSPYHHPRKCGLCNHSYNPSGPAQIFCSLNCRIWSQIDVRGSDECWPWVGGGCAKEGYGVVENTRVARYICKLFHGPMTKEQDACHSCDNPPCCNPAHLWPGTNLQNHQDCAKKSRMPKGEENSSSILSEKQVRIIKGMPLEIFTRADIARILGCNWSTVNRIVQNKYWQHVI